MPPSRSTWSDVSPTGQERFPLLVFRKIISVQIVGGRPGFFGCTPQGHMDLVEHSSALFHIALRACSDEVAPRMSASKVSWNNVVDGELFIRFSTVLARITIPAEDLLLGKTDAWSWPLDHIPQPNYGWLGDGFPDGVDIASPVEHHLRFTREVQRDGSTRRANIQGFVVRIQQQNGRG